MMNNIMAIQPIILLILKSKCQSSLASRHAKLRPERPITAPKILTSKNSKAGFDYYFP